LASPCSTIFWVAHVFASFQNIREKQGLAYAVFSELTPYSDAGMMTVYAGTATDTVGQVIDLTIQDFTR